MKRALLCLLLLFAGACGGAAKPAAAPREPAGGATPAFDGEKSGTKGEGALEPIDVRASKAQASFDEAQSALAAAGSDCAQLCKALGSMTRATERLCELAKESTDDKRCTDATAKLDGARAKVKASCGGCE